MDLENELIVGKGVGEGRGEGVVRKFGMDKYTVLHLKWITNKDLLYSTWGSAQYYLAAWMGGEFWGIMNTCLWLSSFAIHLKLS